jgi:hypothetical protein
MNLDVLWYIIGDIFNFEDCYNTDTDGPTAETKPTEEPPGQQ